MPNSLVFSNSRDEDLLRVKIEGGGGNVLLVGAAIREYSDGCTVACTVVWPVALLYVLLS
jgi:hypothetical protein